MNEDENSGQKPKGIKLSSWLGTGDGAQALLRAVGGEQGLNSARAVARQFDTMQTIKDAIAENEKRENELRKGVHVTFTDPPALRLMRESEKRAQAHREEELALLRRAAEAGEANIAELKRREQEAKAGERRMQRLAILGLIGTVAGLLLAAWPFIKERIESM